MKQKNFLWLLAFVLSTISICAQGRLITGEIKDKSDDMPLPGVNVLVKGTTNGHLSFR